ncbi:MAG: hypothetical protein ACI8XX_000251 [Polaribacter sp.]|jgi:hypothetical protein
MNELPLKDIHLPDGVSWWPLAPGWWLLGGVLVVVLFLMFLLLPKLWRWLRYKPVRSLSLKEFYLIQQGHQQQGDQKQTLQAITSLLRRTVMSKSGRIGHAGVVGDDWISQLNQMSNKDCFTQAQGKLLKHGRYKPTIQGENAADIDSLLESCESWIKSLPKGGSHAAT